MARPGRPRKTGVRKPCGRLRQAVSDSRIPTALTRMRDFGVTLKQSVNPLAGYMAGVLYLRGKIKARHMGHFFSFLQIVPSIERSIPIREKVDGGSGKYSFPVPSGMYRSMTRALGRDIQILHELARDRLICSVDRLIGILEKVPLTRGGSAFITQCEIHHPKTRSRRSRMRMSARDTSAH